MKPSYSYVKIGLASLVVLSGLTLTGCQISELGNLKTPIDNLLVKTNPFDKTVEAFLYDLVEYQLVAQLGGFSFNIEQDSAVYGKSSVTIPVGDTASLLVRYNEDLFITQLVLSAPLGEGDQLDSNFVDSVLALVYSRYSGEDLSVVQTHYIEILDALTEMDYTSAGSTFIKDREVVKEGYDYALERKGELVTLTMSTTTQSDSDYLSYEEIQHQAYLKNFNRIFADEADLLALSDEEKLALILGVDEYDSLETELPIVDEVVTGESAPELSPSLLTENTEVSTLATAIQVGEETVVSLKDLANDNQYVMATIRFDGVRTGQEALTYVEAFNESVTLLGRFDVETVLSGEYDLVLLDYTLTASPAAADNAYFSTLGVSVGNTSGDSYVLANGIRHYIVSRDLTQTYQDLAAGKPATYTRALKVPKGSESLLVTFDDYNEEGATPAYFLLP